MFIRNKTNDEVHIVDELIDAVYVSHSLNPDGTIVDVYYVAADYVEFYEE